MFKPASRPATPIRLLISGPAGSGKSLSALRLACAIGRTAALDCERGTLAHYAGMPDPETGALLTYDEATITGDVTPAAICRVIEGAAAAGYAVLIIDGISHLWRHLRDQVDAAPKPSEGWSRLNGGLRRVYDAIHAAPLHILVTTRTGTVTTLEAGEDGRVRSRALGSDLTFDSAAPYEFDTWIGMDIGDAMVHKCRPVPLLTGTVHHHPGPPLAAMLAAPCFRPATPQAAPQATQVAPDPSAPAGEAPAASGDDLPAQTASPASIAEVRAACGLAAKRRSVHTEEILDVLALHCGLTPGGKIETVPASRADLDALLSALRDLGVPRG